MAERVASPSQKERKEGLEEVEQILSYNRRSQSIEAIKDKAYNQIFDTLFGVVLSEKSKYVKPTSKVTERANAGRCRRTTRQPQALKIYDSGDERLPAATLDS